MRSLGPIRREVEKLQAKQDDDSIRFRLPDGSIAMLTHKQLISEDPDAVLYVSRIFHNASKDYCASDGSKLHILAGMVDDTLDEPFIPWERWGQLHPVMAIPNGGRRG